jgi:hypothetical protein
MEPDGLPDHASGEQRDRNQRSAVTVGSDLHLLQWKSHWLQGNAHRVDDRRFS